MTPVIKCSKCKRKKAPEDFNRKKYSHDLKRHCRACELVALRRLHRATHYLCECSLCQAIKDTQWADSVMNSI